MVCVLSGWARGMRSWCVLSGWARGMRCLVKCSGEVL